MNYSRLAGVAAVAGCIAFLAFTSIAALNYEGYSLSENYLSDLGVGQTALWFNSGLVLAGALFACFGFFLGKALKWRRWPILSLSGIGLMGIGLFDKNQDLMHLVAEGFFFSFLGLSQISFGFFVLKQKHSTLLGYSSILLGLVTLGFMPFYDNALLQKVVVGLIGFWFVAIALFLFKQEPLALHSHSLD